MAYIDVTLELIQEEPRTLEIIKNHYSSVREIVPSFAYVRTFNVEGDNIPIGHVQISPILKRDGDDIIIVDDIGHLK